MFTATRSTANLATVLRLCPFAKIASFACRNRSLTNWEASARFVLFNAFHTLSILLIPSVDKVNLSNFFLHLSMKIKHNFCLSCGGEFQWFLASSFPGPVWNETAYRVHSHGCWYHSRSREAHFFGSRRYFFQGDLLLEFFKYFFVKKLYVYSTSWLMFTSADQAKSVPTRFIHELIWVICWNRATLWWATIWATATSTTTTLTNWIEITCPTLSSLKRSMLTNRCETAGASSDFDIWMRMQWTALASTATTQTSSRIWKKTLISDRTLYVYLTALFLIFYI